MNKILTVKNLSKSFGSFKAVDNLSFDVEKGSVFGLLGPNGSGKTTTMGMILDVIHSSSGSFEWFGNNDHADNRKKIGAILETPNFYPYMSATDNLKIVAQIKGAPYSEIEPLLKRVKLFERKDDKFKTFSLGMKQRLAIAAALLNSPEVLLLDEPTNGLDPQGIHEIRELVKSLTGQGLTIIISSHLLDEIEKVCTDVLIMQNGKKVYQGSVAGVSQANFFLEISSSSIERLEQIMTNYPHVISVKNQEGVLLVEFEKAPIIEDLSRLLAGEGIFLSHLITRNQSLEEKFINLLN